MSSPILILLLLASTTCEWVEISQQHYKKPIRPAHNHPLLTAAGFKNDKVDGNRVYINHSLSDNWKTVEDDVKVASGNSKLNRNVFSDRSDSDKYKTQVNEETVRRQRPADGVTENTKRQRVPVPGNIVRVRPTKKTTTMIKPLDPNKGPIKVLDLSDLEDITGGETSTRPEEVIIVKTTKRKPITTPRIQITTETSKTSSKSGYANRRKDRPGLEIVSKEAKGSNKNQVDKNINVEAKPIRKPARVEINEDLHKTSQRPTTSPKFETIDVTFSGVGRIGTTAYKFPNLGHVKRVQLTSNTTKVTHIRDPAVNRYVSTELPDDEDIFTKDPQDTDTFTQKIKSSSRQSTTEKYQTKKINAEKIRFENLNVNNYKVPDPEEVMIEEILKEDEGKLEFKVHKVANVGIIKRVSTTMPTPVEANNPDNKHNKIKPFTDETPELETDGEVLVEDEEDNYNGVYFSGKLTTKIDETPVLTTFKPTRRKTVTEAPEVSTQIERYEKNPHRPVKPSLEPFPEFVTKEEHFSEEDFDTSTESDVKEITTAPSQKATSQKQAQEKIESQRTKNKTAEDNKPSEEPESNEAKPSTMEKLIKFLKTVTDIITRNTRRGVRSKMQYLEDLRDTIMANIEERIEATFPNDDAAGRRTARSAVQAQARGHVEFPSSESALMTISFLTFAVFLIKLVLQVIQAYKQKTMMMMPTMVAAVGKALAERRNYT